MNNWLKKNIDTLFLLFGGVVILSVITIQFLMLNRTLIASDEGWYLCLLRDVADYGNSRYQFLFHNMFHGDIYYARLFVWILSQVAWIVLGMGIGDYFRKQTSSKRKWMPYVVAIISVYIGNMFIEACPSPNYITLNRIAAALSIGSMLMGFAREKWYAFIISGFFLAALFPIMITNLVILPIILVAIYIVSNNKWRDIGLFLCGFALFFAVYFAYGESPTSLMNYIQSKASTAVHDASADYSVLFWFKWVGEVLLYLVKMCVIAAGCYFVYWTVRRLRVKKKYKGAILAAGIMALLIYGWTCIEPLYAFRVSHMVVWTKDLYWIMFFVLIIDAIYKHRWPSLKDGALGLLLVITPLCLSFGTDVPIIIRQGEYWMFFIPAITLLLGQLFEYKKFLLLLIFSLNYIVFVASIFSDNWNYENYLKSSVPVKSIGIEQNIKLEQKYVDWLDYCQSVIPKGEEVLASNACWGHVVLLDYQPLSYSYYIYSLDTIVHPVNKYEYEVMTEKIQRDGYCWIMTAKWEPELQQSVQNLQGYDIQSYTDGTDYTYYRVTSQNDYE